MAGPSPRSGQYNIDADIFAISGIARGKYFGCGGNAGQPTLVDGKIELGWSFTGLDLDKNDGPSPFRDEIDLAARRALAAGENAIAFQP